MSSRVLVAFVESEFEACLSLRLFLLIEAWALARAPKEMLARLDLKSSPLSLSESESEASSGSSLSEAEPERSLPSASESSDCYLHCE
jgi:hypothetical protein